MKNIELENNIMKTDLTSAVKNYKNSTIVDCINEAIVNSIQANATEIKIKINSENGLLNDIKHIDLITIEDDGDGFNKQNRESFLTYLSRHKEEHGCKGIGRLSYLKTFKKVLIKSIQNNELVEFNFTTELNEQLLEPKQVKEENKQTIIILQTPKTKQKIDNDKIYQEIYNHIYPFLFLYEKDCKIIINNDKTITRDDVKDIEKVDFEVKKSDTSNQESVKFHLWYRFKKIEETKAILDDFICVNNRPMYGFNAKKGNLLIPLNAKSGYQITFLLESDWINRQSNANHEYEEVEDDKQNGMLDLINWQDIRKQTTTEINKLLNSQFPELKEENNKKINDLKEKYPHYADFIENDNISFVDEKQLLKQAKKQYLEQEDKLENNNISIDEIQRCVSNDLIRYILHRQRIIEKLQEMNKHNESLEQNIHNLLLQKGLEGKDFSQIELDKNNLWLLDDKFMSYNYIASDRKIENLLQLINNDNSSNQDRPDIAIYTNTNDNKKIVFIELKKFNADGYDNSKGLDQLTVYSKYIAESGINEIYCYLIINLDDKTRTILEGRNYIKIFSQGNGEIWQNKIGNINSYVQIISPNAIIADANARNKTFLDIIKKSKLSKSS